MPSRRPKAPAGLPPLSKREGELMDAVYRRGSATVQEVQRLLDDPPGYSSVRKQLDLLEQKGLLRHTREGRRYRYHPTIAPEEAGPGALRKAIKGFFGGDVREAMVAMLALSDVPPSEEELAAILREARAARKVGGS